MSQQQPGPATPPHKWPSTGSDHLPPDLLESWAAWAIAAEEAGEPALALSLWQSFPGTHSTATLAHQAQDLIVLQRSEEAADLLESVGVEPVTSAVPDTYGELVLAGAYAARGDRDAWSWLRSAIAQMPSVRSHLLPLVYSVACSIQDTAAADQTALDLVERNGANHPPTWVRAATAWLSRRADQGAAVQADLIVRMARTAGQAATSTLEASTTPPHPRYAIAVAEALHGRGDAIGARLLLHAYERLHGTSAPLRAAQKRFEPHPLSTRVRLGVWAAATLLGAYVAGKYLGIAAAVLVWTAMVVLPGRFPPSGLERSDRKVWWIIQRFSYDQHTHTWRTNQFASQVMSLLSWVSLGGLLGIFIGFSNLRLDQALGIHPDFVDGRIAVALGTAGLVLIGGVLAGLVNRFAERIRLRQDREAQIRQMVQDAMVCRCLDRESMTRGAALAYMEHHLQPETDQASVDLLARTLEPLLVSGPTACGPVRLMRCPDTHVSWLTGQMGADRLPLALRGTTPAVPDPNSPNVL